MIGDTMAADLVKKRQITMDGRIKMDGGHTHTHTRRGDNNKQPVAPDDNSNPAQDNEMNRRGKRMIYSADWTHDPQLFVTRQKGEMFSI